VGVVCLWGGGGGGVFWGGGGGGGGGETGGRRGRGGEVASSCGTAAAVAATMVRGMGQQCSYCAGGFDSTAFCALLSQIYQVGGSPPGGEGGR
jgi:hypothetical protein